MYECRLSHYACRRVGGSLPSHMPIFLMSKAHTTLLIAMCLHTEAASKKKESAGRVCPLYHLVGTVSMCLSVSLRLCPCAPIRLVMMCAVSYGSVHLSVCCVCHVCVCTRVTSSRDTINSGASNHFRLEWNIGRSSSPFFPSISGRNPTENLQPVFLNR